MCRYRSVLVEDGRFVVSDVSSRLADRVRLDFPAPATADAVIERLATVAQGERVQAAVVLWAGGDLGRLEDSLALCQVDWRDVLVRGGLADDDWPQRLDVELGAGAEPDE